MPPRSATRPIRPSNASISRTRCPFPRPPIAGLQDIAPIVAKRWVTRAALAPMRAAAAAASQPAWPPPTTITSYCPSIAYKPSAALLPNSAPIVYFALVSPTFGGAFHVKHGSHSLLGFSLTPARQPSEDDDPLRPLTAPVTPDPVPYFPIQKSRKITSKTFSTSIRPRSLPNALVASRRC